MDYRYGRHTVYQIEHHFVWVRKYRYKILKGEVAERVRELVRQTCEAFEIRIVLGVVSYPPGMAQSEIMIRINGRTWSYLFEEFPHLRKEVLGKVFLGAGYFCATVGQIVSRDD